VLVLKGQTSACDGLCNDAGALSKPIAPFAVTPMSSKRFTIWQCRSCGYVYDEALGDPLEGLSPGTRWEDIAEDWACPMCGTPKRDFDMVEVV
jgi:rubredoxin